jgi:CRP/FNR family transcriptional regulator
MNSDTSLIKKKFLELLPPFDFRKDDIEAEFVKNSILQTIPKGEIISNEGDTCNYLAFIIEGSVRVYKFGETGREITLYRINKGESCILTASCVMSKKTFPAIALSETELKVLLVSADVFREWVKKRTFWANYFYNLLSDRLTDVITIVEEVAFKKMDVRIADFLLRKFEQENCNEINITHQIIAGELGSSREVISRLLKDIEHHGLISLSRNKIELLDKPKLITLSRQV